MIKFVYFDVGGVVVKDFSASKKWQELQSFLGVTPDNEYIFSKVWKKYRNRICIDLEVEKLIHSLNTEVGLSISRDLLLVKEFTKRFEKNITIWPIIIEIKKTVKVGLLTNMYVGMFKLIEKAGLFPPIQWDSVVDSSIVKMQKPDREIFEFAQKKAGVKPQEILFIDNQEKHVLAAQENGGEAYFYDSGDYEKSNKLLNNFLVSSMSV